MLSVGITGGMGSGKTTICKIFQANWQIPIYVADSRAKEIILHDKETHRLAIELFGKDAFIHHTINTKHIAQLIFSNHELKKIWESHVHKKVIEDYHNWKDKLHSPYHLHESALIFEAKLTYLFDKIIVVTAPLSLKLSRLKAKGISEKEALSRINHQLPDNEKQADFYIINNEQESVLKQVINIHNHLIQLL